MTCGTLSTAKALCTHQKFTIAGVNLQCATCGETFRPDGFGIIRPVVHDPLKKPLDLRLKKAIAHMDYYGQHNKPIYEGYEFEMSYGELLEAAAKHLGVLP